MAKKALIISWHFPPYKSSSGFNLFKRFKDSGYEYDVIHMERDSVDDNLSMFRFASIRINRYEVSVPSEDPRDPSNRDIFISKVCEFVRLLLEKNHYRLVISHSHEIVSHLAALAVKREYPSLAWVASFGDPIGANPFNEAYKFPLIEKDSKSELEILKVADRVVVTNSYQKKLVLSSVAEKIDPDKFYVLPHCYEPRMYPSLSSEANKDIIFRFLHVGMLYKHKRTSEPFVLATRKLLEKHPELKGHFAVEFYGANDSYIKEASGNDLSRILSYQGSVSYLESLSLMVEADCLLLRDADFSDQGLTYTPFYPGKLADYLGADTPILAVTMEKGFVPDMFNQLNYPYRTESDIEGIAEEMYRAITTRLQVNRQEAKKYSCEHVGQLAEHLMDSVSSEKTILFAGHDLKFLRDVVQSYEADTNFNVLIDQWKNHVDHDEALSREYLNKADIIFCEWGLGNIEWYANNKKNGQRLLVRIHLQENQRPEFLRNTNIENIDYFIFIAPYRYEEFVAMHDIPRQKAKMIFNTVDVDKFDLEKLPEAQFTLGFIGMVPWRKRFDRALDIFEKLWAEDNRYVLRVKGKRPEDYPWMLSKSRSGEMAQYDKLYKRIQNAPWKKNVFFDGHGNDMPEWFQRVGYILSTSDFEGSHQAVAEGMAAGSLPIIYDWDGADTVYPQEYVFREIDSAVLHALRNSFTQELVRKYALDNFSATKVVSEIRRLCEMKNNLSFNKSGTFFELNVRSKHRDAYWENGKVYILSRPGYDISEGVDWLADPYNHRSWRWLLNNFKWMDSLLFKYLKEGEVASIKKCVEYFFNWYNFYLENGNQGEFLWKDDAVSFRSFRIAVIARYIINCPEFSESQKEKASDAVRLHYNELIDPRGFKKNNHGLFQVRGLMALSTLHSNIVDFNKARLYAAEKINFLWSQQYGSQCIHLENSTGYHQYIIQEFSEILQSPEFSGCDFCYDELSIKEAHNNTKYFFHPNGISTLFGDSNLDKRELPKFSGDKVFNEAGYAFLAGNHVSCKNSYLAVRTGFPSNIHRHSDDFSFEWSEYGKIIFQDSGRYSYEYENPYRIFLTSTRAHSTVSVDGGNYPWWGDFKKSDYYEGAVKQYEGDNERSKIVLGKSFSNPEVTFIRTLDFVKGRSLTVVDNMMSNTTHSYEQWFHLAEDFEYLGKDDSGRLIFNSNILQLSVEPPKGTEALITKGQESPFIQGWVSYKEKQLTPRWSFGFIVKDKDKFSFNTRFNIKIVDIL